MDNQVSVPLTNPSTFLAMKQRAKASLTQDMTLDKATDLTAQRNALLLNPDIPDGMKTAQLKQLNRQVARWTQKVREPFGEGSDVGEMSPTQNMIKALIKTIKSPDADPPVIPKRRPTKKDASSLDIPTTPVARKKRKDVATQWLDF